MVAGSPQGGRRHLVRRVGRVVGSLGNTGRRGVVVRRHRIGRRCARGGNEPVEEAEAPKVCGVLGASPVGGLAAGRCAVALVGPSVQDGGADRAAGSRHMGVTYASRSGLPPAGTSYWPPAGTFSWPGTFPKFCQQTDPYGRCGSPRPKSSNCGSGDSADLTRAPGQGPRSRCLISKVVTRERSVEGRADARDLLAVALQEIASYRDGVHEGVQ